MEEKRPNEAEIEFLNLAYDRFYDLFEEIMEDSFWNKEEKYRFSKEKDIFAVYAELSNYEPIQWVFDFLKSKRPPMESEIADEFFKFIRNLLAHFPLFESWNYVWFNKKLVNWNKKSQSIDRFLERYQGYKEIEYRFWEPDKRLMTYISINLPTDYTKNNKIYLKDIIKEKDGIKFCIIMMKKVLDTQVEEIKEKEESKV